MAINNAILGNIYNYYQTSYAPKPTSRFDAHKKSDLKDLYNSIVRLSKEEPVYLLKHSSDVEKYTISMKESALQFKRDIASMGGLDAEELFEQKAAYSSDPSIAKAEYRNSNQASDEELSVQLTVETMAKPQINKGTYLDSDTCRLAMGTYSFDVTTATSSYELQFSIGSNDTNHDIQSRLARLINNAAIGLTASVSYSSDGKSALSVSSVSNGLTADGRQPFTISDEDTSQQRGIVDYLGIRNITQPATWAKYSVDGESFSSPDNQVVIADVYSVTFTGESAEPVTIGTKPDYESLKDSITGVAASYNNFIRTAAEYLDKHPRTTVLIENMKRMSGYYSSAMESLGITQEQNGTLSINEEKLSKSLTSTANENTISEMRDFTKSALRKISQVQLNPMDYVDKRIVAYKNPYKTHFANPYVTSAYSGMLFNSYM